MCLGFQSLIGKLQTRHFQQSLLLHYEFQSLIGKLQTKESKVDKTREKEFQSLIGKLQTRFRGRLRQRPSRVSIPHR